MAERQPREESSNPKPRGRAAQGRQTRETILAAAVDIASVEGLEGLTIGGLSSRLGMSKSGLFAHFGSKEELQLATIAAARGIFVDAVVRPAFAVEPGIRRLWALLDGWLAYVERGVFRGGCFFAAASAEFDSRPGPVRDRIAETMREWLAALETAVAESQTLGHLNPGVDPCQLAFEFNALAMGTNWSYQLYCDHETFVHGRRAVRDRLRAAATPSAPPFAEAVPEGGRP